MLFLAVVVPAAFVYATCADFFLSYQYLSSRFFSEIEETVVEEPPTCESPEPMSYYLHHDPDHPMSSFSVINKMRVNIQVSRSRGFENKRYYSSQILLFYVILYLYSFFFFDND